MTPAQFDEQFNRLTQHFHLPLDTNRDTVAIEWLKAVEHYHVDALEHAVTELIRTAQDRYWPALGKLLTAVRSKFDKYDRAGKCATCHGSGWLDSAPFKSNGMVYGNVCIRCGDCGIPAPEYQEPRGRSPLTSQEFAQWRLRDTEPQYMPDGMAAKPWDEDARRAHKAAMLKAFEGLRIKLFGSTQDAA